MIKKKLWWRWYGIKSAVSRRTLRWNLDNGDDLTLSVCGRLHVTYYKWDDSAIIRFGRLKDGKPAPKAIWRAIHSTRPE